MPRYLKCPNPDCSMHLWLRGGQLVEAPWDHPCRVCGHEQSEHIAGVGCTYFGICDCPGFKFNRALEEGAEFWGEPEESGELDEDIDALDELDSPHQRALERGH